MRQERPWLKRALVAGALSGAILFGHPSADLQAQSAQTENPAQNPTRQIAGYERLLTRARRLRPECFNGNVGEQLIHWAMGDDQLPIPTVPKDENQPDLFGLKESNGVDEADDFGREEKRHLKSSAQDLLNRPEIDDDNRRILLADSYLNWAEAAAGEMDIEDDYYLQLAYYSRAQCLVVAASALDLPVRVADLSRAIQLVPSPKMPYGWLSRRLQ